MRLEKRKYCNKKINKKTFQWLPDVHIVDAGSERVTFYDLGWTHDVVMSINPIRHPPYYVRTYQYFT